MGILQRFIASIKLERGQCGWCKSPLRDDARTAYCSDQCAEARLEANTF